jgi:hypothetical protein
MVKHLDKLIKHQAAFTVLIFISNWWPVLSLKSKLLLNLINFSVESVDYILVTVFIEVLLMLRLVSKLFSLLLQLSKVVSASLSIFIECYVKWLLPLSAGSRLHTVHMFHTL